MTAYKERYTTFEHAQVKPTDHTAQQSLLDPANHSMLERIHYNSHPNNEATDAAIGEFCKKWLKGDCNSKDIVDLVTDAKQTGHLPTEHRAALHQLIAKDALNPQDTDTLTSIMTAARDTFREAYAHSPHSLGGAEAREAGVAIDRACIEEILNHTDHHPIPALTHGPPELRDSLAECAKMMLQGMSTEPRGWPSRVRMSRGLADHINQWNETGLDPGRDHAELKVLYPEAWFDPEVMVLSPEARTAGFNIVNQGDIDFTLDPGQNSPTTIQALNLRYILMVNDGDGPGIPSLEFARLAIAPELNHELAQTLPQMEQHIDTYSKERWNDVPDHWQNRVSEGDTNDPMTHLQQAYGRSVMEHIYHADMGHIMEVDSIVDFIRNDLTGVRAAESWLLQAKHLHEEHPGRTDIPGYTPVMDWTHSTAEQWRLIIANTGAAAAQGELSLEIEMTLDDAIQSFTAYQDIADYLDSTNNGRDITLHGNPDGNTDQTESAMLREAIRNIKEALTTSWAADARTQDRMNSSGTDAPAHNGNYNTQANAVLQEMSGDTLEATKEMSQAELALYDELIRRMTHADFLLQTIAKNRETASNEA